MARCGMTHPHNYDLMQGRHWSRRGLAQEDTEKNSSAPHILRVAALRRDQVVFPARMALRHSRVAQSRHSLA